MSDADFEALLEEVRTQSKDAPGSDTRRVTIRSLDAVSYDAMTELLDAVDDEDVDPGRLEFYISEGNVARVVDDREDIADEEDLGRALGRPVNVPAGMPDDAILLADPDAIDGADIADPTAIACGTVGTET